MDNENKDFFLKKFDMKPHPEGGYYVQTYKSNINVQTDIGERTSSTAIYFLLSEGEVSQLHKIKSDEVWHFYYGAPVTIIELDEENQSYKATILGNNFLQDEQISVCC